MYTYASIYHYGLTLLNHALENVIRRFSAYEAVNHYAGQTGQIIRCIDRKLSGANLRSEMIPLQ